MPKKFSLREFLREERAKLDQMTLRQGISYIWQYFGLFIVGFIGIVWLIVYGIIHLISGAPEYWLYVSFANSTSGVGNHSRIWQDFVEYAGYDTKEKRVEFSSNMYFDYNRDQARGNEYYNSFVALADTGTLDVITMSVGQLAPLGQSGRLISWDMEECAALREKYGNRLIYYDPPEGAELSEPFPVGIDVSDSLLVTKYGIYPGDCALGITSLSTRMDAIELFLEFIFRPEE